MINWIYFPLADEPPLLAKQVVDLFKSHLSDIDSGGASLSSNQVLAHVGPGLQAAGFAVELGKKASERISVPVLFGLNGRLDKSFDADAYHEAAGFVIEIEAGRAVTNYQFLKDLFEACMMHDVSYLAIAVRNVYRSNRDFESVRRFFETLYASRRLSLPLKGILVIGY